MIESVFGEVALTSTVLKYLLGLSHFKETDTIVNNKQ